MTRAIDVVSPPRLGAAFRRLLASAWLTNLGDGMAFSAGPLLVASQTSDPLLVAAAGLLQRLPWLLFGLQAGVLADRLDRRTIMVSANLVRAGILGLLATTIATDVVSVTVVLVAMFALGTAETLVDVTAGTLLPMIVEPTDLGVANARLSMGHITLNQLAGPPLGALLFAAGMVSPFVAQALLVTFGAFILTRISFGHTPNGRPAGSAWVDIAEGARWLWDHAALRTLTLTVLAFNVTFGATIAIEVLYAQQRLGLGEVGFGLMLTASAIGGLAGSGAYGRLERRLGMANLMRIGLIIETTTHLTLALTRTPWIALAILVVFGVHESVWGITVSTIRQRAVPTELQGRVGSVYMLALMGGLVIGSALGGIIARTWGITAPFWFAFVGSIVILARIWRQLVNIAHAEGAKDAS